MRNLLSLVGLVVVVFAGCGWYFKWYNVSVTAGTDGKQHISVDVDTRQMSKNLGEAKEKVGKLLADAPTPPAGDPTRLEFVGPPAPAGWKSPAPAGH